jgi:trk system potassium uptake protein TrkH
VAGALCICLALLRAEGLPKALWSGVFHSVSAFCNAGFSIYPDGLVGVRDNLGVVVPVMVLIVTGGIGFLVLVEVWEVLLILARRHPRAGTSLFSFHSKVVLRTTAMLLVGGALLIFVCGLSAGEKTLGERIAAAIFQSVTARTAGFNTVTIGALPLATLLILILLMFVGGSPASTAGGIKTTGLAITWAHARSVLRGSESVTLLRRSLPPALVRRTLLLLTLALAWNVIGFVVLSLTEAGRAGVGLHDLAFEQVSAFGTVGLSTGLTPGLTPSGKVWIMATMYLGRLGPLTLACWVFPESHRNVRSPEGRVLIG